MNRREFLKSLGGVLLPNQTDLEKKVAEHELKLADHESRLVYVEEVGGYVLLNLNQRIEDIESTLFGDARGPKFKDPRDVQGQNQT